jgi:hypothetical protein
MLFHAGHLKPYNRLSFMKLEPVAVREGPVVTTQPGVPLALRLTFSFPVALSVLLVLLMALTVRNRFNDPDMWWHLKTGEIIWNTHHIPTADTFSYTTQNHAYVPHEWLAQLSIYAAYHFAGYPGMMLWLYVLGSLLLIAGYALCWMYSGNGKVAFLGALIIWLFSTSGPTIRPQMIGYFLLICELLILHVGKTRGSQWFLALPPLFLVWVNCHGSFFLGLAIAGVAFACSFLDFRMGLLVCHKWVRSSRMLGTALALSVAVLFINPAGWEQVTYPLNTMFHQNLGTEIVSEWQPLDLGSLRGIALLGFAAVILMLPIVRGVYLHLDELILLVLTGWLGLHHSRMDFVFGLVTAPILSRLLRSEWEKYDFQRDRILPNLVLIPTCLLITFLSFPDSALLARQVEQTSPVKAIEFIRDAGLNGNLLNDYVYGGYLIWAAPEHKVFVDGRADVFEWTGVLAEYYNWMTLASDPEVLVRKYNIQTCLLAKERPISRVLTQWSGWKVVYSDDLAEVLVKTAAPKT